MKLGREEEIKAKVEKGKKKEDEKIRGKVKKRKNERN